MNLNEKLQKYNDWVFRMSAYRMALSIIAIDKLTVAPEAGADYRDKRTAFLAGELFSVETDPEMEQLLKELLTEEGLDEETKRAVKLYAKMVHDTVCIPKDEFVASEELMNAS